MLYNNSISLTWNNSYSLFGTNFYQATHSGVYVIYFYNNYTNIVIKVGQSEFLANRIPDYRIDRQILNHCRNPTISYAKIPVSYLDGVERYLGEHYCPLVCKRLPRALPIRVNLPF